jgi:hypothetical protein
MIGMPITGRHVWGHAYGHDILTNLISSIEHNYSTIIFCMYISTQRTFWIHVIFQLSTMDDITFKKLEILSKLFLFPKATSRLITSRD